MWRASTHNRWRLCNHSHLSADPPAAREVEAMSTNCWSAIFVAALVSGVAAQQKSLPKVVLVGDSIRMGYAPLVAKRLDGKAIVVSAKPNGEDSGNVLRNLEDWVIREQPDVVHINAGLHDLKLTGKNYQVPLASYEQNLKTILERLQKETKAKVIFATTTPIVDNLHAKRKVGFDRFETDVQKYNEAAVSVMKQAGTPINDLHKVVESGGKEKLISGDGTHYTPAGYEILAAAVTDSILRSLAK
jgi:lysophospholipase L1-like esterase